MSEENIKKIKYFPNEILSRQYLLLDETNTPLDLTGATFEVMVRDNVNSNIVLAIANSTNGKIIITSVTATIDGTSITGDGIEITFPATDTLNIYQNTNSEYAEGDLTSILAGQAPIPKTICFQYFSCVPNTRNYDVPICCAA